MDTEQVLKDTVASGPILPLAMLGEGEVAHIAKVKGLSDLRQHLSELGFVEGAEVKVISRVNGDVIVSVKGARLGLNRQMSSHIMVSPN
ncbi:MAG: ferrous iron transport protein A [Atopobiaceae bacterium]|nr:ferrous iron transport protein A [Atopobiaceae bacterium]